MRLSDVDRVQGLGERRKALLKVHEKCRPNSVPAHGDWWFVEYNYGGKGDGPQNRIQIPAATVCELVEGQIKEITEELIGLGVTVP